MDANPPELEAAKAAPPREFVAEVEYQRDQPIVAVVVRELRTPHELVVGASRPVLVMSRAAAQQLGEQLMLASRAAGRQPLDPWVRINGPEPIPLRMASTSAAVDPLQAETFISGA